MFLFGMICGVITGFFVGRTKWGQSVRFIKMVQFGNGKYGIRLGFSFLSIYKNFDKSLHEFPWHCKLSEDFDDCCKTSKEKCESYLNGEQSEMTVN
jgi:hypothetical protein